MEWLCFGNTSNKRLPIVRVKILRRAANDLSSDYSKNFACLKSSGGSGVRSVLGVKIGCVFPIADNLRVLQRRDRLGFFGRF